MEWMKTSCSLADEVFGESNANSSMHVFDLQVELFGRGLSEIYAQVLDLLNNWHQKMHKEIDEALRPDVYALIYAGSADDLQYLHSVFGEGPCRLCSMITN